jgi:plastocyanin
VNAYNHPHNPVIGPNAHAPWMATAGYDPATHGPNPNDQEIDLNPEGTITIDFTVPKRPGTWGYACFRQSGQHYLNGMHGTVTVLR